MSWGVAMLALAACSGGSQSVVTVTAAPTESASASLPAESPSSAMEPSSEPSDPVQPEASDTAAPAPTSSFVEIPFGTSLPVSSANQPDQTVTLGKPVLAKCQYSFIGCSKPEVGDRVVQIPITIKNDSSEAAQWGSDFFVLEFADGTQMSTTDGAAYEYAPDNSMDYDVKVRPGSTYTSLLVFEAPKGAFKVLILTSPYDGEPFAAWK